MTRGVGGVHTPPKMTSFVNSLILTIDWKEIYLKDVNNQNNIAKEVKRRLFIRKTRIEKAFKHGSIAPGSC